MSVISPSPAHPPLATIDQIEPGALRLALDRARQPYHSGNDELAVIDVSEEGEFGLGHLFWAINVPYSQLEQLIRPLVPRLGTPMVLIDHGRGIAWRAARRLQQLGYHCLSVLPGGVDAWRAAGLELFNGVYVPGKALGEWVEQHFATPAIAPAELLARRDRTIILDPRSPAEYAARHIPGALSCPGGELLRRLDALEIPHDIDVVIACGGRTRGIMGAQTLINAGVPHTVRVLDGGTHGWQLAGLPLEYDARRDTPRPQPRHLHAGRKYANRLTAQHALPTIDLPTLQSWQADPARTTYLFDIRLPEAFADGKLPGSRNAPGGQLLQAPDRWIATQGARLVLIDLDGIQAVQVAYWLRIMGWHTVLLRDSALPDLLRTAAAPQQPVQQDLSSSKDILPPPPGDTPADLAARIQPEIEGHFSGGTAIAPIQAAHLLQQGARGWSLDHSRDFLQQHPPGVRWASRARLDDIEQDLAQGHDVVLFSNDGQRAHLAALDLEEVPTPSTLAHTPAPTVFVVDGGIVAWEAAGLPLADPGATDPALLIPPAHRIDFLYWAHERRQGNAAAMRAYLEWERQLPQQLAREGEPFRLPDPPAPFPPAA